MDENKSTPSIFGEAFLNALDGMIQRAVERASNGNGHHDEDHLLDAEEAAKILSVSPDWLYRHAKKLPFTRKLGPKMLRFSYQGIQKYLATRNLSS